jgi:hypothetical protein
VEILVGQRDVDHQRGAVVGEQARGRGDVIGVDLRGADPPAVHLLDLRRELVAARDPAAGEHDIAERVAIHRALVGDDAADAACADDEDLRHKRRTLAQR